MSARKFSSFATVISMICGTSLMSACSTISDAWEHVSASGDDPVLRTPTGYYEHVEAKEYVDPLSVPSNLKTPYTDRSLVVPEYKATAAALSLVGEKMDVRSPVVPKIENGAGIDIFSIDETSVVWFLPYNKLTVANEHDAWEFLLQSLASMKIDIAKKDDQALELYTAPAFFNAYGEPYDAISEDVGTVKYNQSYKIEVGNNPQGNVGYLISLVDSSSFSSDGDSEDSYNLNTRQKRNFVVGFANTIINTGLHQLASQEVVPEDVQVLLGRDNNGLDVLLVQAPYQATWNVMLGLLRQYSFTLEEYSVSGSLIKVSYSEEDPEFYQELGVEAFGLESDDYIVRVGVMGDNVTSISFYSEDDKPLPANIVAKLYSGMSKAISKEFSIFKQEGNAYLSKFED